MPKNKLTWKRYLYIMNVINRLQEFVYDLNMHWIFKRNYKRSFDAFPTYPAHRFHACVKRHPNLVFLSMEKLNHFLQILERDGVVTKIESQFLRMRYSDIYKFLKHESNN